MLDLLLPRRCVVCGTTGDGLCGACAASLPPAPDLAPPPGLDACWSLLEHRDTGRAVVAALKFHHHRDAVALVARAMAALVDRPVGVVTWAPTSARHRRHRGYDQAQVLAQSVADALAQPCRSLLDRTTGAPQAGRGRAERLSGPGFHARPDTRSVGPVLLVDDVRTTGATLCAAADALTAAHHAPVLGVTLSVRR